MTGNDIKNGIWAGLIGGLVFLILEMIMVPVFGGGSAWGPPRMIAAIVLGKAVLPPPATFDLGVVMVALIVHFTLSLIFGIILGFFINRMTAGTALFVGAIFGIVLYLVNFFAFTGIFPWFAMARNWISVFAHIVFGLVTAWAFVRIKIQTGYRTTPV